MKYRSHELLATSGTKLHLPLSPTASYHRSSDYDYNNGGLRYTVKRIIWINASRTIESIGSNLQAHTVGVSVLR